MVGQIRESKFQGFTAKTVRRLRNHLYDRALRFHPTILGIATPEESGNLFPACDRSLLLTTRTTGDAATPQPHARKAKELPLSAPDLWEHILADLTSRS